MILKKLMAMGLAVTVCGTNVCPAFAEMGGAISLLR